MSSKISVTKWASKLSSLKKLNAAEDAIDPKQIISLIIYGLKAELVKAKPGTNIALCCENSLTEELYTSIAIVDDSRSCSWAADQDASLNLPHVTDFSKPILITVSLKEVVDPSQPRSWKLLGSSIVDVSHCTFEAVWGPSQFTLSLTLDPNDDDDDDDDEQQQQHSSDLIVGNLHCIMKSEHTSKPDTKDNNDDNNTIKALRTDSPLQRALSGFSKLSTRFSSPAAASSIKEGCTISSSAASTPVHTSMAGTPKHQVYSIYAEDSQTNSIIPSPDQFDNIHLRNDSPDTLRRRCAVLMAERDDLRLWQYEHASKEVQKDMELDALKRSKDVLLERLRNAEYQLLAVFNGSGTEGSGEDDSTSLVKQLVDAKIASAEAELRILELEGALKKSSAQVLLLEKQIKPIKKTNKKKW